MIKRERFYDGCGNELRIDETQSGNVNIMIQKKDQTHCEIEVPLMKLFDMLKASGQTNGKHAKVYEIR